MTTHDDVPDWHGRHLVGPDGGRIGKIDELYADDETGRPTWATVHTGLLGRRTSFVPIAEARAAGADVQVPFDAGLVKDAPGIDPGGRLTPEEEDRLYRHYGTTAPGPAGRVGTDDVRAPAGDADRRDDASAVEHPPGRPDGPSVAAGGHDEDRAGHDEPLATRGTPAGSRTDDDAMTLSEEQVHVGTQELPATKVRMRKVTVTEHVQMTVPVTREEVRLEEVPADAPDDPDGIGDGEVTLRQQVPVVEKETVDRERVRVGKERQVDDVPVTEQVRREEVSLEHEPPPRD